MDVMGMVLIIIVHPADIIDYDGAELLFNTIKGKYNRLQSGWADVSTR